jgi:predicted transposase YbfD/YdcC
MSDRKGPFGRFPKEIRVMMESFEGLEDPRQTRGRRHRLIDVVMIALFAMMSGENDAQGIEDWGIYHEDWLRKFLALDGGIPSQDTFLRVFSMMNPEAFRTCFMQWVSQLKASAKTLQKGHVAIDGKTLRGSRGGGSGDKALHMVNAWMNEAGMVLGQVATDKKSNEIEAIPRLLDLLDIRDCVVTIDAMGCQRDIAQKIVDNGGHYLLAVKDNQPTLKEEIALSFKASRTNGTLAADMEQPPAVTTFSETDADHGRIETRTAFFCSDLGWLDAGQQWPSIGGIGMIERERTNKATGETSTQTAYYVTSDRTMTAERLGATARAHWSIENNLHWVLDVTFKEDHCRVRKLNAAHNFALVRQVLLGLLKAETSVKRSIAKKRSRCAWGPDYMLTVLAAAD